MTDLSQRSDDSGEYIMLHTRRNNGHEVLVIDAQKPAGRTSNVYGLIHHQELAQLERSEHGHALDNAGKSIALTITIEDAIGEFSCSDTTMSNLDLLILYNSS